MISIRKNLLTGLFVGAILAISIITVVLFLEVREEIYEIMDYQMEQIALVHSFQDYTRKIDTSSGFEEDRIDSLVQIWDSSNKLIYTSDRALNIPLSSKNGFSLVNWHGQKWRVLTKKGQTKIQVAQSMELRQRIIFMIAVKFVIVMVLFFLLLGGWIIFTVRNSFKPLSEIRKQISEREVSQLAPIPDKGVPEEVLPIVQELNDLLFRLDRAIKSQKEFLANAAHELKTPLTALDLQIQNAHYAMSAEDRRAFLKKIKRGINRANAMVNQLLTISRMESGFLKSDVSDIDLNILIAKVLSDHYSMAAEKDIALKSQVQGKAALRGNFRGLDVMLSSLVDNAIKYAPSHSEVRVNVIDKDADIVLEVIDQGPGIPSEERKKVFQRFYRYQGQRVLGSGLGLSIVKNIADFHHAEISLEDGPDCIGLKVTVIFPSV
jgi:two-component system OmpR family sensor kinase